ncbi:MAG: exodeoxyribonuclease III [Gracilibacteraceae bacterium]|jgi:exodeoxyribonuclease-3|nr:exodeoxyribonuclease III [Gracilibacteraceae bacterium]
MRLISWNVNGLRACLKKGFGDFFRAAAADVFCLQETKLQPEQITEAAAAEWPGYTGFWHSARKKGYSGTAALTKTLPLAVAYDIGREEHQGEGRVITLEFADFFLVNVYTPNAQRELARLPYRLEWDDAFRAYLSGLDGRKPVVVCGDMNVAHQEIDLRHPKANRRNAGFTDEERGKFTELLAAGFIDTFRYLYPERRDAYTWWSYMRNARENNSGWRIDYFLVSRRLAPAVRESAIYAAAPGSDHCPVGLELEI